MSVKNRATYLLVFMMIITRSFCESLSIDPKFDTNTNSERTKWTKKETIKSYLIPDNHPLQEYLHTLFINPHMFKSAERFREEGFQVKLGHRKLMVGAHPATPQYLFKKFTDAQSQIMQLKNYIKRIEGTKVLRECIKKHNFKHLIVPQKWLYKLPSQFSQKHTDEPYLLVVENMDIYDDWENPNGVARQLYYNMDIEILTELCIILHEVGGCDAYPRNQPFTRSGKIAFVDTEHVGKMKGHFIKHIVPALNQELQAYALALWMKLEDEEKAARGGHHFNKHH